MSDPIVYWDEMGDRLTDKDVERIIAGEAPDDDVLSSLATLAAGLRANYVREPSEETVTQVVARAAANARSTRSESETAAASSSGRLGWARRRLINAMAAGTLFVGMTGAAFAADDSSPGDVLYGLDRAVEAIGIGAGGTSERIAEAQALFASGKTAEAVEHAATAAENAVDGGGTEAADALLHAADTLRHNDHGSNNAVEVRDRVANMLEWMASHSPGQPGFGQDVANMARQIAGRPDLEESEDPGVPGKGNGKPKKNGGGQTSRP